jgi:hypothetical protein
MTQTKPVFSAGGRCFTWADVIDAARARGDWAAMQHELLALLARERELAAGDALPEAADVRAAANEFRYRLNLLSADELQRWLAANDVTFEEWTAEMRRSLLKLADRDAKLPAEELQRASWVHAVCCGKLAHYAQTLAEEVAVHLSKHPGVSCDQLGGELHDEVTSFREQQPSVSVLQNEINNRQIDWTRIDLQLLAHNSEMVAQEAAMCVKEDGRTLADVAREAGAKLHNESVLLEDVEPALRTRLIGAHPGDLIGPVSVGDEYQLVLVTRRLAPALDDPALRQRATETVIQRAMAAEVNRYVNWHEHF